MLIVGIAGKKRSGKDTIAGMIQQIDRKVANFKFADPIKHACREWLDWEFDHTDGNLKETVDPIWGISPRYAMQTLGTEVGRLIHPEIWCRYTIRRITDLVSAGTIGSAVTISDVRFMNEVECIKQAGGVVIRVYRPSTDTRSDSHASEVELDAIRGDYQIHNTEDDLDVLREKVRETWKDIGTRSH